MSVFDKDWFNRRSNYVVKDESQSIGWDSSFVSEFSRYLYGDSKASRLCMSPQSLVPEFREIMNSVNLKKDTECYINTKDDSSYTDGKKIFVSADCLKDKNLSDFNKLDIMIGLLLHESAHCIYSNFSDLVQVTDSISAFTKEIQNILEDEAIEEKLCNRWPGNANFISTVKERYFGKAINEIVENTPKNLLDEVFSILLLAIRYPKRLIEYVDKSANKETIEKMFAEIYEAAYRSGYLKTHSNYDVTKKTKLLANEIVQIILEYIDQKEFEEQSQECMNGGENGGENGEKNKSSVSIYKEAASKLECLEEAEDNEQRDKLANKFEKIENDIDNKENKKLNREITAINNPLKKSSFVHSANEAEYKKTYNEIRRYVELLKKKVLVNKQKGKLITLNNMRNGCLNTSKLVEAYQGIEHIYDKRILKKDKIDLARYALVLVLDESGSMTELKPYVEKIAILLYEAFSCKKDIELFVFGHGDKVNTYIDKLHRDKFTLAATEQQYEQNEGESYKDILNHVHSQTKLNAVIISITDSYYCYAQEEFKDVLAYNKDKYKDSFNLIKLKLSSMYGDDPEDDEVIQANDALYGKNCWMEITDCDRKSTNEIMMDILDTLSPILIKNYSKSEKLHR